MIKALCNPNNFHFIMKTNHNFLSIFFTRFVDEVLEDSSNNCLCNIEHPIMLMNFMLEHEPHLLQPYFIELNLPFINSQIDQPNYK